MRVSVVEHGAAVPGDAGRPLRRQSAVPQLPTRLQRTLQGEGAEAPHTRRPPSGLPHIAAQFCRQGALMPVTFASCVEGRLLVRRSRLLVVSVHFYCC